MSHEFLLSTFDSTNIWIDTCHVCVNMFWRSKTIGTLNSIFCSSGWRISQTWGGTPTSEFGAKTYCYHLQANFLGWVVFSEVSESHSVDRGRGSPSEQKSTLGQRPPLNRDPTGQRPPLTDTPLDRDPPGQRLPWTETPQTETPLDRDPETDSPILTSSDDHQSWWYASYWNAYLLSKIFAEKCKKMKEIGPGALP